MELPSPPASPPAEAAPLAPREASGRVEPAKYAGFAARFAARGIDGAALLLTLGLAGRIAGFAIELLHLDVTPPAQSESAMALMGLATLLGLTIYHAVAEGIGGATLGKWLVGLRVANDSFGRCSFGAACSRNAAFWVDLFGLGLAGGLAMAVSPRKKRLGDRVAKTIVVPGPGRTSELPRIGLGIALGLVLFAVTDLVAFFACSRFG